VTQVVAIVVIIIIISILHLGATRWLFNVHFAALIIMSLTKLPTPFLATPGLIIIAWNRLGPSRWQTRAFDGVHNEL
jgi:hypothetical protein